MANLVHHLNRDLALLQAITGMDSPKDGSVTIQEDYLVREKMENLRERGYPVPEDFQPTERCAYEKAVYRSLKLMEGLEQARVERFMEWEAYDPEFEDYIPQPPRQVVVIL